MPLYEYQCESCHHRFEKIQKFSDPLVDVCPVCGGVVKKLFSSPSFQFKGTGFYATDYAKKSGSNSNASSESTSAATASPSTGDSSKKESASDSSKKESASDSSKKKPVSDSGKKD